MKKLFFSTVFVIALTIGASAQSGNDGYYTGRATAALNSCIAEARKAGYHVNSKVEAGDGSCLRSVVVTFWGVPPCPPNTWCIQVIEPIGSVEFDCNNEIVVVNCESGSTL